MPLFGKKRSLRDNLDPEWVEMFEVIISKMRREPAPRGSGYYEEALHQLSTLLSQHLRENPHDPEEVNRWRSQYMDDKTYYHLLRQLKGDPPPMYDEFPLEVQVTLDVIIYEMPDAPRIYSLEHETYFLILYKEMTEWLQAGKTVSDWRRQYIPDDREFNIKYQTLEKIRLEDG
jgi:hypothetical protein